ncbi:hypothetical protein H6A12_08325 [Phocea massiliensis]|uniref:LPXTG cell wall anchor domain-containing protein n=1 Tax=Merdimmobilis hominis TaxID=2897707 RepID=A0A938X815_9FIRM|nr:hypothetical protein [Merdimmobilis hominis]MBM6921157.1 hypothetical protein [Merdimmobilis hominis]
MKEMQNQVTVSQNKNSKSWLRIVIIVLAVLLVFSAGALAARCIYLNTLSAKQSTATVENNLIGNPVKASADTSGLKVKTVSVSDTSLSLSAADLMSEKTAVRTTASGNTQTVAQKTEVLKLYQGSPSVNQKFEVKNMLPGDTITKYFSVQASHNQDITLFFNTEITSEKQNLGDVLHVVVEHVETGKILCDAPFSEIDGQDFAEVLKANAQNQTVATYKIDVSVSTSIGNEYQGAGLTADFNWYVEDEGGLTPPDTGDDPTLIVVSVVFLLAAVGLLVMLLIKRKKGGNKHDEV